MGFTDKEIQRYSECHTSQASGLLRQIERETYVQVLRPRMISGHMQGRILSMISKMIKPKSILEIGTYTGYSALCLAEGLVDSGRLVTIDINEELESRVRGYFEKSEFGSMIDFKLGDALLLISKMNTKFDLVFIDADKVNYVNYYNLVLDKMNSGGFIIVDNVLWSGKVVEPIKNGDKDTIALLEFNKMVHDDMRVENVLMPVRDGLTVLRVI